MKKYQHRIAFILMGLCLLSRPLVIIICYLIRIDLSGSEGAMLISEYAASIRFFCLLAILYLIFAHPLEDLWEEDEEDAQED